MRKLFTESLVKRGQLSLEEAEGALDDFQKRLQTALDETRQSAPTSEVHRQGAAAADRRAAPRRDRRAPRGARPHLRGAVAPRPTRFHVHPKLLKQFEARDKLWADGEVDWALAEAMAYGSLLLEGTDIRIAGQDTRRGTFSHRHAVLVDHTNGDEYAPLAHLGPEQGKFWIYDSLLSEYAALGFEYGYSVVAKDSLVVWEAQFGDFWNGASTIVDQFVVSAEDKWNQTSGLVLYLPHGYEGQGPEHCSARVERFLTLCAEDNIQVANCTQASQIFHLLRRQVRRAVRKPLVVFTPKSLLRAKSMRSPVDELLDGRFRETIDDPGVTDPARRAPRRARHRQGRPRRPRRARRGRRARWRSCGSSSSTRGPTSSSTRSWPATRTPPSSCGSRRSPRTWARWNFVKGRLYERFDDTHEIHRVSRHESGSPATRLPRGPRPGAGHAPRRRDDRRHLVPRPARSPDRSS